MKVHPQLYRKIAAEMGAEIFFEPRYELVGRIRFASGKHAFFRVQQMDVNPAGAVAICRDKNYTSFFLRDMGYQVPEEGVFLSEEMMARVDAKEGREEAKAYANELGYPVVIKPNRGSLGKGFSKVWAEDDFDEAFDVALQSDDVVLVQRCYEGRDFRLLVFDGELIAAYERSPLSVVGDGMTNLADLLAKKKVDLEAKNRKLSVLWNEAMEARGRYLGYSLETVLAKGEKLVLRDNANLSTGGDSIDWTEQIHPTYRDLAIEVVEKMGLKLCGVDVMTSDICQPLDEGHVILELNSAPGLKNFMAMGERQTQIAEDMMRKIFRMLEAKA